MRFFPICVDKLLESKCRKELPGGSHLWCKLFWLLVFNRKLRLDHNLAPGGAIRETSFGTPIADPQEVANRLSGLNEPS